MTRSESFWSRGRRARWASAFASALGFAATFAASSARAQQQTFHLDRIEVAGAPDDGIAIMRPYTRQNTIFYGQLALGYSLNPLKMTTITSDRGTLARSKV